MRSAPVTIKRFFLIVLITAVPTAFPVAAQAVFAPFVSRLQGEVKNNLIRLSWTDSPDIRGPVYMYRSTLPFNADSSFQGTRPVEIPYGAGSYVDEIETGGTLYYFVAASDETGRRYTIPIPFTNTVAVNAAQFGVVPEQSPPALPADSGPAVSSGPVPPAKAAASGQAFSSLEASSQGEKVLITFAGGEAVNGVLYRSTRPIRGSQDLSGAIIVRTGIISPFADYPAPGIPYYYAVVSDEDIVRGTISILPGSNATTAPVQAVQAGTVPGRDIRAIPLPQISVQAALPGTGAQAAPGQTELGPEAAKALGDIPSRPQSMAALQKPGIFARDLDNSPPGADDYVLSLIVKGPFMERNWEKSRAELVNFLALPRNAELASRAKFYLGQSYYFLGRYREALFEFLAIQGRYPAEANEWIQLSLGAKP